MEKKLTIENTRGLVDPCIYMLTAPNGKIYVGSALNGFHERSGRYRNERAHGMLQNTLKKYEAKNFVFSILESSNTWQKDKLQEREQHYLDTLRPFGKRGYNVERVAGVVNRGNERRVSQFTRAGEPVASYESITRASVMARAGLSCIAQCCTGKKPSAAMFIWLYSEEVTPNEIARRVKIAADKKLEKPVSQYTRAGEFIASFESVKEAALVTSVNGGNITTCCKSKTPSAGRCLWLYTEEATPNEIARRVKIASSVVSSDKRRVSQYTRAGEFIASFESVKEAARATSVNASNISVCCKGRQKTAGGFIWKYA